MKTIMCNAMAKVNAPWSPFKSNCWYDNPWINDVINYGVKRGWLIRCSVTQVQWSEHMFEPRQYGGKCYLKENAFN